METRLTECVLCPRSCHVDRTGGASGYCGQGETVKVARASLHMWEEPCISGVEGSGTVFFSGCPLKCVYCQNQSIALGSKGRELRLRMRMPLGSSVQSQGKRAFARSRVEMFRPSS